MGRDGEEGEEVKLIWDDELHEVHRRQEKE